MKVLASNADNGGCGFYRVIAPVTVLKHSGLDVVLDPEASTIKVVRDSNKRIVDIEPLDVDLVVLQRPLFADSNELIPILQSKGIAVVVEIDDDFWSVDTRHQGFEAWLPKTSPEFNYDFLTSSCKSADLVTVSTPSLARMVPNDNTVVIRNCAPGFYLEAQADRGDGWDWFEGHTVVGWTGNPGTHAGDLEVMGDALRRAVLASNARFLAIGDELTTKICGFEDGESAWSPWVDLKNYPQAVKALDVGIVPLRRSTFNECKSYLKGLEYAALGVAFVATPTSEYRMLNSFGVGDLAEYRHDWYKKLKRVIVNEKYRAEMVERGIEFAKAHTYEKQAWRWAEAWEKALTIRRGK